jgi:(2R)-3-sulfolactate dehydrogenase (NADP+)
LPLAVDAARECGIASLAVAHSHTCTSLGYFTEQIAAEGLIGFGMTNASAIVAGPGGKRPTIGTNPLAVSVPGPGGVLRMHADFSTAAVALGKITMAKAAGEEIPLGWAVDAQGRPTTDPDAALGGALVSAAGYKGWALGLMVEIFAAGLTGSVTSQGLKGLKLADGPPHDLGQIYILIDPGAHTDRFGDIAERIAQAVADDGGTRIPGARARGADHAQVPEALWAKVLALSSAGPGA